jgi:glycosyltransferase involved in cell wall biosynthesis
MTPPLSSPRVSQSTPDVAVVVATRNRARRLEALLRTLAVQNGARVQVVVVDDGSTDSTPELLANPPAGLDLKVIRHEQPEGPATSRNEGWRASAAPVVAFADDDVVVDPDFGRGFVEAHRRSPGAVLQGRTDYNPEEMDRSTAFWRSIRVFDVDPFYPTCNIAYPRQLLERLGGFDEAYRRPAGEDTDLGWRARELGAEPEFVDGARARHAVHQMGVISLIKDARRMADNPRVAKRHPGLRSAYHRGWFWNPSHERLLFLLAGLAAARPTRGASMLLALPYYRWYRRHHPTALGTLAALPAYAAIDAAGVVSLLAGSVRHRALIV